MIITRVKHRGRMLLEGPGVWGKGEGGVKVPASNGETFPGSEVSPRMCLGIYYMHVIFIS
jgi:hypothetical protein